MAILISAQDLEKSFGSQTLFRSLSFGIETGDRIGLIGPNGAGKTTLLKILAGESEADGGEIIRSRGLKIGYLNQDPKFTDGHTVFEAVAEGIGDDYDRLGEVHEWLARLHLNQDHVNEATLVENLSGGWKKRVALARELVRGPDLLLLDEPTNHLDLESILWLETFLETAKFATLTVTHDRLFLQRISNRIFDLDRRNVNGLLVIKGSYSDYLEAKQTLMAGQEARELTVKNTLRRETEWLRRGAKARITKQQARIDRHADIKEEAQDLQERNRTRSAQIDFQSADRHPQKLIEALGISKAYGERTLFAPIDILITPKTRLGLLGTNGCGKTTLIRTLLGQETPDTGTVRHADKLQAAYFAQYRDELSQQTKGPKTTVIKTVCPDGDYVNYRGSFVFARSYLDRFLFRSEQMDMPVEKLSGGEKARLRIAQLMLEKANVLILDEPTNDLDIATLNVLEESLVEFDGAVILVTHDRYFLDQVANEILAFPGEGRTDGHLERFASYGQWESWIASGGQNIPRPGTKPAGAVATAVAAVEKAGPKKRLSFKDKHELENMETTIFTAEARLKELQEESAKPENLANAVKLKDFYKEIGELEKRIEQLYARWAELEKMVE